MIKLTIEFKTIDEAIVALGKLVAAPDGSTTTSRGSTTTPVVATSRKGRSDAGKKRGSYKNPAAPAEPAPVDADKAQPPGAKPATPEAAEPNVASQPGEDKPHAPSTEGHPPGAVNAAPAKSIGEKDTEAQKALEQVLDKRSLNDGLALLSRYGVKKLRDLPSEMRAEFLHHAKIVAEGGEV